MEKQIKEIIRSVVREGFISELSKNDVHVKEIMKFYDKGTYSTKKAVSIFVSGKTNATRNQILDDLGDMGYNDVWEVMDHFKLKLESVNEESYKVAGRPVTLIKGKKSDATDWKVKFQNGKETSLSDVLALIKPFPKGVHWRYKNLESVNESDLKGYLVADVVDDIVKSIGSKFVSGQIKNAPNRNYIYLKLTDIKFGSGVVKMLKSQFGIDAKIDKTFGNIPSVSFASKKVVSESINEDKVYIDFLNKKKGFKQDRIKFNSYEAAVKWAKKNFDKFSPDMIKYESVNKNTLNEGFGDSIKKIRNLAIKMASTKFDRAKSHLNLDKIASANDFDGKDTMNKATAALLQQKDLDEDLKSAINKIAVKLGTGATMLSVITALVSMGGWIQYLDSSFTKWYYTEIQKLAEPQVMKVMQDMGKAGQAEGSIWGKFGMYAFFIFFTIAVISLVAARMTQKPKKEYVDKKGVERVAAALPQTEEEPIKECKIC
jgi:hypothetical protein